MEQGPAHVRINVRISDIKIEKISVDERVQQKKDDDGKL